MIPRTAPSRSRFAWRAPADSGFTLIELLAVVGFTAVLLLFAVNFYIEISRASGAATERTRESRRAIALLDRIARDLEAAVLLRKPDEVDPLYHPWVFLAEDHGGDEGAEHLRFSTRSRVPRSTATHESDLEVVSYALREAEAGGFELLRWSSPRLPEELDRTFPESEADGAVLFAEGLASFGVRFMDDEAQWTSEWDSSTLVDSSELPLAAEISVAILPEESDPPTEEKPEVYLRRVLIPVRPLDLQALPGAEEQESGCPTGGMTVGACLAVGDNSDAYEKLRTADPDRADEIAQVFDDCFSDHADSYLFDGVDLVGCQ